MPYAIKAAMKKQDANAAFSLLEHLPKQKFIDSLVWLGINYPYAANVFVYTTHIQGKCLDPSIKEILFKAMAESLRPHNLIAALQVHEGDLQKHEALLVRAVERYTGDPYTDYSLSHFLSLCSGVEIRSNEPRTCKVSDSVMLDIIEILSKRKCGKALLFMADAGFFSPVVRAVARSAFDELGITSVQVRITSCSMRRRSVITRVNVPLSRPTNLRLRN